MAKFWTTFVAQDIKNNINYSVAELKIYIIMDTCLDLIALQYTCMIVMGMLMFLCLFRAAI